MSPFWWPSPEQRTYRYIDFLSAIDVPTPGISALSPTWSENASAPIAASIFLDDDNYTPSEIRCRGEFGYLR